LGGTGPAGSGLAARLASVGYDAVIGSRSSERADEICADLRERWGDRVASLSGADNAGAAEADLVVVATPWDGAAPTVAALAGVLDGKVVVSMANALTRIGKEFQPLGVPRGSIAASIQAAAPGALVAAAFHHVPAKELGDLDHHLDIDVLVCSDHPAALAATSELVVSIPGMRPLEAGPLSLSTPIEAFVTVLLQLNVRYRTRAAVKFTGIEE